MALCEAYAMTGDKALRVPAQKSVDYIVSAQDRQQGGWGAEPKTPGDMYNLGWQILALNSAQVAQLEVPKASLAGTINFCNLVQRDSGAYYGSKAPGKTPTPTAIGQLARMQSGWKQDTPALERGVAYLSELGPNPQDMDFTFFATQVMFHYGGETWQQWNRRLKEQLLGRQIVRGDFRTDKGSWTPPGKSEDHPGGRLAETALAVMTLEVYYRYAPRYAK